MSVAEKANKKTEKMDAVLKFTPEQKTAVYEINLKTITLRSDVRNNSSLDEESKKAQIKTHYKERWAQIEALLTPEQKKILKEKRVKENDEKEND
jgi:hypothetical protein